MVKGNKKGPRITVSLQDIEYTALSALAETYDVSLSWLTRQAIVEFLERYQNKGLPLPRQVVRQSGVDKSNG